MTAAFRFSHLFAAGALASLAASVPAQAGIITYEEALVDARSFLPPIDYIRNLERTRSLGDGSVQTTGDDSLIELENAVGEAFGRQSFDPVTYSHLFFPLGPVETFHLLTLQIVVGSVSGEPSSALPDSIELLLGLGDPNDPVAVEGELLGYLSPTNPFATTTFEFSTGNAALIDLWLLDDRLDVTITPTGPGFILEPEPEGDRISVRSSTLQVQYELPEPVTLALLGTGLLGVLGARRRQARLR